jgi:hypothetical protein
VNRNKKQRIPSVPQYQQLKLNQSINQSRTAKSFMMKTTTTRFHPSLSTTAVITRKMTSSFASLFTIFLVVTLLLPTINKIMTGSSITDVKQEQKNPSRAVHTTGEKTSQLLSRRQVLCTATAAMCTPDSNF